MRTNIFSRILSALLASLTLFSVVACSSAGGNADETTAGGAVTTAAPADTTPAETEPATDEWGREIVDVDLPADLKFDGETVTIMSRDQQYAYYEFSSEQLTGDIVGDAIYDRNRRVEERLGITIEHLKKTGSGGVIDQYRALVSNAIMADTNEFDVVAFYAYYGTIPSMLQCYYNLADLPNVNYDKPWWRQSYIEAASAHDQFYTVISDLNLSVIDRTLLLYYNKKLADQYSFGNLYELVLNGQWTIDKLIELTKDTATDINGSGALDDEDFYGIVGCRDSEAFDGFFAAFNIPTVSRDAEGVPTVTLDVDIAGSAIDKLLELFYNNNGAWLKAGVNPPAQKFYSGQSIFWITTLMSGEEMRAALRDMTDDYGILPLPKMNEQQENYGTTPQDAYNTMSVMRNVKNPELVGATLELMSAESWKTVRPEYCENTMKYRYMRDSESGQIFDLIVDSVFFDYSMVYNSSLQGLATKMRAELQNNRNQLASQMAIMKKLYPKLIAKVDEVFVERAAE